MARLVPRTDSNRHAPAPGQPAPQFRNLVTSETEARKFEAAVNGRTESIASYRGDGTRALDGDIRAVRRAIS